jgi:predicted dienelactone hydrolase
VVIIAHGFQLPAKQYYGYAERLATHGLIACTADFPADFQANHVANAQDLSGALDWVLVQSTAGGSALQGKVDINQIGVMGHSLGGKVSVLAAKADTRFKAVLGLDPVDAATGCDATKCPDASNALPLPIPTAFLGETLDSTGTFQACAPAADNYQTFFAKAAAPSIEVTLNGANHMSFIDDVATCGLPCTFCKPATLPGTDALAIARSYAVAFFARHLRAETGYDAWLTGSLATQKWGSKISLQSK